MKREKRDRGKMNVQRRAINRASIETLLPCPSVLTDVDPVFFFFFFFYEAFNNLPPLRSFFHEDKDLSFPLGNDPVSIVRNEESGR